VCLFLQSPPVVLHLSVLQAPVSVVTDLLAVPDRHLRVRDLVPDPHVLLQADQADHLLQRMHTIKIPKYI